MIFTFDKYGNLIESDTEDVLVQYSVGANTLYASFNDIDLKEYLPRISFERSDGQLSPYIAMAYSGNNICYHFSDAWLTEKAGVLKCTITLLQNNIIRKTASFNLNVVNSLTGRTITNIDDVALSELEVRTYALEQSVFQLIENGSANIRVIEDTTTTEVQLTPKNYNDYTYSAKNLVSVKVTLSDNIGQGFITGLNFKADEDGVAFEIDNQTDYELYVWRNGLQVEQIPDILRNNLFQAVIICDGLAIHLYYRLTQTE